MFKNLTTRTLALAALLSATFYGTQALAQSVVVGGKNFTEQQLIAEMTRKLLDVHGYKVTKRDGMGSSVLRAAQESGQIDVYWEYTGTSLITYNKITEPLSAEDTYNKVKELDSKLGLVWLNPSRANNTYALAMNRDRAKQLGFDSISDLGKAIQGGARLSFASNAEFYARPDGLRPLEKSYGFEFSRDEIKRMDTGLTYQALKSRQVDVALVFATDGRIPAFNFVLLEDDKKFFPSYALAPVIRKPILDADPKLGTILNALSAKLDDQTMARLNASVDVEKKSIAAVAEAFLKENGLI
jgi:osmoprotectant transport system substrate-binding protein